MNGGGGGGGGGQHWRFMECVMEAVEGQMTLKTKVTIFGFLKTFCSIEGIYRCVISTLACVYDWMDNIFQRQPQEIEPLELKIMFSNVGGPTWLGPTRKKIFEIIPPRKAKKAPPRLNRIKC